jgi:hypothetical protein
VLNDRKTGEDELERMWAEVAVVSFKVLTWHLLGKTEENH